MTRVVAYFIRLAVILVGYIVASLAASAFINLIFFAASGFEPDQAAMIASGAVIFSIPFVALFVAYFGFVPSVVVILFAEVLGRRDWLFYAMAGAVVALAFLGFVYETGNPDPQLTGTQAPLAVIGAGMVGGYFYWLSAGRWAGGWRKT